MNESDCAETVWRQTGRVPIRYHEKASRPKSLALTLVDIDIPELSVEPQRRELSYTPRRATRVASSPLGAPADCGAYRPKRHSMYAMSPSTLALPTECAASESALERIQSEDPAVDGTDYTDSGVLRITTGEKPKSRNTFWRNLKAKAQGIKDKRLSKAHSMSNLPDANLSVSPQLSDGPLHSTPNTPLNPAARDSSSLRRADSRDSAGSKPRVNIMRRRSFKLIKKQSQDKKPKPFTKSLSDTDTEYMTNSPDSGISSIRRTDSDYDGPASPSSPLTPIDIDSSMDLSCLRQQFTDAVLQYLNERMDKSASSSRSSSVKSSDSGSSDIFCYDSATVMRKQQGTATEVAL